MRYRFSAHSSDKKPLAGFIVSKNKEQAIGRLQNRGLVVDHLSIDWKGFFSQITLRYIGNVPLRDKLVFTRNLALMIKAGITIDNALAILAAQTNNARLSAILSNIQKEVESGSTFAEAMGSYTRVFDQLYINIIAAAERSGTLAESLYHLADQLRKQNELRAKILGAIFYPALVIISTFVVGGALSIYVLPKLTSLFVSFDQQLPWTTRVVIAFANFMSEQTTLSLVIFFGIIIGSVILLQIKILKPFWHRVVLRIPFVGKVVKDFNLALFSRTLRILLVSGIPANQALEITARTMRNTLYRNALSSMVIQQQSGESLGTLLSQHERLFTPLVHRMIAIGEESGNLDESLDFIANFHEEEVDYTTKNISSIVEPTLLILVGFFVAVLALSIITPIYQITGSFQPR